jgi:uncharacterized protein YebE (UPF0316 family)
LIFALRLVDISLYTMRIAMVSRGRKGPAWVFALCQSLIFVTAIRQALTQLDNAWNIVGYAAGFATGNVLGMLIEGRIAIGFTHLRIISPGRGAEVAEHLRLAGYAATEVAARGRDGVVTLINCSVRRKHTPQVVRLVSGIDEAAFITAENVRQVAHGFWHN